MIVENQSTAIEVVSGVTISSMALLSAVEDTIVSAGADLSSFRTPVQLSTPTPPSSADVVVI